MKRFFKLYIALIILTATACKESFNPPETNSNLNYLVVEGMINTGSTDSTIIKLSRTTMLTSGTTLKPETRATVSIQSADNVVNRNLTESKPGTYFSAPFALDGNKKYRIRIRTAQGKEYASDYVEVKVSPNIDNVSFEAQRVGVPGIQLSVDTRDNSNNSRYYKWDYVETYQYKSNNFSTYIVDRNSIRFRNLPQEDIFNCWRSVGSTNVILASTAKLANDVVNKAPLVKVPASNERFGVRYSIMVNQQVLTKEAFDFWEILKKNTEQVGSIFDSQPSQLQGNVHAVNDPNEIVIGFITAGTVTHKRIFIDALQIPEDFRFRNPLPCRVDTIIPRKYQEVFYEGGAIPVDGVFEPSSPEPVAYTTTSRACVDCTVRGTNIKPAFWQ
ncbi:DUF4249 domain-containing protein [Mucilaginibacter aquatilis]|uniref:DUF4249 family protein n=1 Tax=Mucilaginibacter aquatilis TaxID=1517760 RepID=A0A6I4IPV8_9SPHI|nr:DUF4249 domain-containing protein [Mucilaginibacter aquatilis]MVN90693.1 DUF4249 family protein [Mucilaginibacter aquatilis]